MEETPTRPTGPRLRHRRRFWPRCDLLANQGWDVVAVETCRELREQGETHTDSQSFNKDGVTWLDDKLPNLNKLRALDQRFQLILISSVWMHLTPNQHARAMRIVRDNIIKTVEVRLRRDWC